jgi:D-lactate dehydrogenase
MFGPAEGHGGAARAFESLARKAGLTLTRPNDIAGLCCGTPWKSKGMGSGYSTMMARTIDALWHASDGGRLPVVCDNSSCSEGLLDALTTAIATDPDRSTLTISDAVDFVAIHVLPRLVVDDRLGSIAVHPTCSSTRGGSNANLRRLSEAVASNVVVPENWGCCAFAGDRGMLHPELTASATLREAAEVNSMDFDAYVSCNRTCEIGMSRATGRTYVHVLETLDLVARSRENRTAKPVTTGKN